MTEITEKTLFPQYIEDIKEVCSIFRQIESILPKKNPNLSNSRINHAVRFLLGKKENETFTIGEFCNVAYKVTLYLWDNAQSNRFENSLDTFIESE